MLYKDLIQFEPVENVIKLLAADSEQKVCTLVETYVISDHMAEQFTEMVIPHLRCDLLPDPKGLLIIGNYGTGKSHLMSVIAAIAENAALAEFVPNDHVAKAMAHIAGRFKVIRVETGAVETPLRQIICRKLEQQLAGMGVPFQFPPADAIENNKEALMAMMAAPSTPPTWKPSNGSAWPRSGRS